MKRSEEDELLRQVLADEALERLRHASLADGLFSLQQRRRRRVALVSAAASVALLLSLTVRSHRRAPTPPAAPARAETQDSPVRMITDDQLLALFPDRALALIGPPGRQQLVFLDGPALPASPVANP